MPSPLHTLALPGTPEPVTRIGLGTMQLSLPGRPDRATAKAVVQKAVEEGIRLIDTADSYALDQTDIGHGERLIAEALTELDVDLDEGPVIVATKGGRTRHGGVWGLDGSPKHLRSAVHASLAALGCERIRLYQLHAPDPSVPFAESVGALARLREEGKIDAVGLSNVSVRHIEEGRRIVPVAAVQNPHSVWDIGFRPAPVIRFCERHDIVFLAYGPLGGSKRAPLLSESSELHAVADSLGLTAQELALAWLVADSPMTIPIPGPSRPSRIDGFVRALATPLDGRARRRVARAARTLPGRVGLWEKVASRVRGLLPS